MNHRSSHKAFSVAMAFFVLFSTLSFTMEKHFCGDTLIDVAIFSNAATCGGMELEADSFSSVDQDACCKDEIEILKGQENLKKVVFEDLQFEQQVFLSIFSYSYFNLFDGLSERIIPHTNYSPPHLVADFRVLHQVFII